MAVRTATASAAGLVAAALFAVAAAAEGAQAQAQEPEPYLGVRLGALQGGQHGVRGALYAVDARTLYLRDFYYDGEGPAAFLYVGVGRDIAVGTGRAWRLRDEAGGGWPLRRYTGEHLALSLPDHKSLDDVNWFAVYCDEYSVVFGWAGVERPRDGLGWPRAQRVGPLRGIHGVASDPLVLVDAQTVLLPNFSYDGEAPDAKFWVGRGARPSAGGVRIPDENGRDGPLRKYTRETIVLTLPGELTVFDIGHVGVWCEAFAVDFGHVVLPPAPRLPPSLRMLSVAPQSRLNCEVLWEGEGGGGEEGEEGGTLEVRWAVAGGSAVVQLVGRVPPGEYMAFGLSGDGRRAQMVGADVTVAWLDAAGRGHAVDYYLDAKSQCAGRHGSCPDEALAAGAGSVRLLSAARVHPYSIVTYQRPLRAHDALDLAVSTNRSQAVVWALGPLNARDQVSYHHHYSKDTLLLDWGRAPAWNCPAPAPATQPAPAPATQPAPAHAAPKQPALTAEAVLRGRPAPPPAPSGNSSRGDWAWQIPPIECHEPEDGVFYAQMGPTGGTRGYPAITGHVGWGIAWYINGLLIPEVHLVRGKTYTFVVEGGDDPDNPARRHPFYITDDPVGGYQHKTNQEKKAARVFAGAEGAAAGRWCGWQPSATGAAADSYASFGAYQRTLTLACDPGTPALLTFTPDRTTPDTLYYQCYTHRYLGWKIRVVDSCDKGGGDVAAAATQQVH